MMVANCLRCFRFSIPWPFFLQYASFHSFQFGYTRNRRLLGDDCLILGFMDHGLGLPITPEATESLIISPNIKTPDPIVVCCGTSGNSGIRVLGGFCIIRGGNKEG